jgi:hypothetical protein
LEHAVWRDDFGQAEKLKVQIGRMEAQRDHFDQKYETSRFEASLELPGASVGEARDFMEM